MRELKTNELCKAYHRRSVVDDLSISVRQGEVVGLLGPNGAGKTTSFYMIVGLISPDSGRILLDDREITSLPMYQRARLGISYLPQEPSVFRKLSVEENLMAILETLPLSSGERHARMVLLIEQLGLEPLREDFARIEALSSATEMMRLLADLNQAGTAILLATRDGTLAASAGPDATHLSRETASWPAGGSRERRL